MEKMKQMVDMEFDDEDSLDAPMPIAMPTKPRYPYGLCITLTDKELDKLGFDASEAIVGGTVHITGAMAEITSVSQSDDSGGKCCRVEMQIQKLSIESEDAENAQAATAAEPDEKPAGKRRRAPLYG